DLAERGIEPVIPPRSNRKSPIEYDREAYKRRNLIERCVNRLKQFRRIATRYEKTARAYLSMLCIAAARLWLKTVNTGYAGSAIVSWASSGLVDSRDWVAMVTCPAYFGDRSFQDMKVPQMPLTRLNDSAFDAQVEGVYLGTSMRCFVSHEA